MNLNIRNNNNQNAVRNNRDNNIEENYNNYNNNYVHNPRQVPNIAHNLSTLNKKFNNDFNYIENDEKLHDEDRQRNKKKKVNNYFDNEEIHGNERLRTEENKMIHPKLSYLNHQKQHNQINQHNHSENILDVNKPPNIYYGNGNEDGKKNKIKQKFVALQDKINKSRSHSKDNEKKASHQSTPNAQELYYYPSEYNLKSYEREINELERMLYQYQDEKNYVSYISNFNYTNNLLCRF